MIDERLALLQLGLAKSRAMEASPVPLAGRLAAEAPLAVGAVLYRAHERARALEAQLELEAADPRVAELHHQAGALRRSIAGLLVEITTDEVRRG